MMAGTFKCAMCGGVFDKAWSDEESMKETHEVFGASVKQEDCDVICDDCFKKIDPRQFDDDPPQWLLDAFKEVLTIELTKWEKSGLIKKRADA
jgi:hypothetical protein